MRTAYIYKQQYQHILAALTPENRLALEISLATGLRISDVLNLRTKDIKPKVTIRELKTGKKRQVSFLHFPVTVQLLLFDGKFSLKRRETYVNL